MGSLRLVVALALLVSGAAAAGAAYVALHEPPGAPGAHDVRVVGPGGAALLERRVHVEAATALSVLQEAARASDVAVETLEYPGMGTYVQAIGGHAATGASGWIYEIVRGGETIPGDRSAALRPLEAGDAVVWRWVDG